MKINSDVIIICSLVQPRASVIICICPKMVCWHHPTKSLTESQTLSHPCMQQKWQCDQDLSSITSLLAAIFDRNGNHWLTIAKPVLLSIMEHFMRGCVLSDYDCIASSNRYRLRYLEISIATIYYCGSNYAIAARAYLAAYYHP
ncbi:unnamed protein product, partial [Cylicocyclus nassatus]